jgi:hypothetical protein
MTTSKQTGDVIKTYPIVFDDFGLTVHLLPGGQHLGTIL